MRVHDQVALHPDEQVLAARNGVRDRAPGQVGGGEPGDPEVAPGEHPPGERIVQATCVPPDDIPLGQDRKSTRLNSSHPSISYAVFCLKKKKKKKNKTILHNKKTKIHI